MTYGTLLSLVGVTMMGGGFGASLVLLIARNDLLGSIIVVALGFAIVTAVPISRVMSEDTSAARNDE